MSFKGKKNVYVCPLGHKTVTIDTDEGVTPFMLRCKQKADEKYHCTEFAQSSFYRCDQSLTPEYEWYKPTDIKQVSKQLRDHVSMGGLVLRKLSNSQINKITS